MENRCYIKSIYLWQPFTAPRSQWWSHGRIRAKPIFVRGFKLTNCRASNRNPISIVMDPERPFWAATSHSKYLSWTLNRVVFSIVGTLPCFCYWSTVKPRNVWAGFRTILADGVRIKLRGPSGHPRLGPRHVRRPLRLFLSRFNHSATTDNKNRS